MKQDASDLHNIAPPGGHLPPAVAWALAFGCAVGWDAFVKPGTTFLPMAGLLGTVLDIALGALVMGVVALNFHCLMQRHPDLGGPYTCVKRFCNHDHAFLAGWFLLLAFALSVWANVATLVLVKRTLFHGVFQFGFHSPFAGSHGWAAETILPAAAFAFGALTLPPTSDKGPPSPV